MSEPRKEFSRTLSTAIPAIPVPSESAEPPTASEDEARARITALEKEARALGAVPSAALLFHEMGLLWETPLHHARNAAVAYQQAFRLAPRFLANIRAARKLFAEVGNWAMVVTLLDAEIAANEGRRARAALLFEKSQILEQRLSRSADAAESLALCLELPPEDVTLLVQLEQVYSEKSDYPALVKVYRLLADEVTEPAAKAVYLTSAGLLLEDRLNDAAEAARLFRQAFSFDRRDPQLLAAMKRLAQREGTVDEELAALAAEAESQGPSAAPTFLQISKAYERLGRPEDALAALLAARRVSPEDPLILSELARIYEGQARFDELANVLRAWVESNADDSELVAINFRLAALYEQLSRENEAISRYQIILARVPGHAGALTGVGKLFAASQNWQGLLETYEAEAAATDDSFQKAGRIYKAAETLEERLHRVDEAIVKYNACLSLSPGFLPAQKALVRLYEKLGKWEELVEMYEADLLQTAEREQQVATLNKIAALYEDRINDLERATECLKRVLELSPDHLPTMRNLARLYERGARWQELLELNEAEARLESDTKQTLSLSHRNAEILEDQLKDRAAAVQAWERVLQLSPAYLPALRALGRLYGQDGRWEALIKMHRAEAEIASNTEQAASLTQKVGELYEHKVKDLNQAISSYREVLTLAPQHVPALRALGRIYRTQGDWESLIEILRAEAANRSDPTERANAIFQAAAIWEDQLHKPEAATEAYYEVVRLAPNHLTALRALERLLTTKDDVKELIVLLDRQTQVGPDAAKVSAWLKLARLYLDRLNEPARAATSAEAALALEPQSLSALRVLERIRALDKPRRAELRSRIAEAIGDEKLSAAIKLSNFEAKDPNAAPSPEVLEQLKSAYLADPTDEALGLVLERALQKASDARGLIELYTRRKDSAIDSADLLQLQLRIAHLLENRIGDLRGALEGYQAALRSAPELYPALLGQLRCYQKLGDFIRTRMTLEAIARTAKEPSTAIGALLDAAKLARDVERNEPEAEALYQQVLAAEPLHPEAGAALDDLLTKRGGAEQLSAHRERRGEAKLAQRDLLSAAREFYDAAKVAFESLKQPAKAIALLDRALMAMPTLIEALEMKAALAFAQQDYPDAAAALSVRVQQGGDPKALARLNLKLGALYHDHLNDMTRAMAHLQTALSADPSSIEALERLASIHTHGRNWTGATDCMRRLLEIDRTSPGQARHTLALARITDEGFGDIAQAITLYRKVLTLIPGDPLVLDRLATLYERTGALPELAAMLEQQALQATDVKKVVALKLRTAALYARSLNDPPRGVAALRQVIELDPTQISAWTAIAELYGRDANSTALAIDAHRNIIRLDPTRADSLHALFRMWETLKQLDRAFCAAALLVFLKQADEMENQFFIEARQRLSNELKGNLQPSDILALHPLAARHPLAEVLRAVGDQFVKLFPPQFEALGVDRKADRIKAEHAVYKALQPITSLFGIDEFEVYLAKRGLVTLETTDPMGVFLSLDVVRRFNLREQRFIFGRVAMGLWDKTALIQKLDAEHLADVLGNSVRIHQPYFEGLGRKNDEQIKQLRRTFSRKALRRLEDASSPMLPITQIQLGPIAQGLSNAADRAGLVVCGDPTAGLNLVLREESLTQQSRPETAETIAQSIHARNELKELMVFAISDDYFRLRHRIGLVL